MASLIILRIPVWEEPRDGFVSLEQRRLSLALSAKIRIFKYPAVILAENETLKSGLGSGMLKQIYNKC